MYAGALSLTITGAGAVWAVTDAGGIERVRSEVRKLQSVPAGHLVVSVMAQAMWGEFDAAMG